MAPDPQKVQAVHDWPTPTESTAVCQFLGLASYYQRYIQQFADITAPLHVVTKKGVTQECTVAFATLKNHLLQAPVLTYPKFTPDASEFVLQTDASAVGLGAVGLGAVLEQEGHVVAYASRFLIAPERQYSIIQKECLAVVYALKQSRHYLLERHFQTPLQWLSAQKMEGMLCRWALAIQEYDFHIVYWKGSLNANVDALSRTNNTPRAITLATPHPSTTDLHSAQLADPCNLFLRFYRHVLTLSCPLKILTGVSILYGNTNSYGPSSRLWMEYCVVSTGYGQP